MYGIFVRGCMSQPASVLRHCVANTSNTVRNGILSISARQYCCFRIHPTLVTHCSRASGCARTLRWYSKSRVKYCEKNDKNSSSKTFPKGSEVKRLLLVTHPERWRIAGAVCLLGITTAVTLSVPFWMGRVIDIINTASKDGTLMPKLNTICSVLFCVFVIGAAANYGRLYLFQTSGQRIVMRLREKMFSSVMKQEVGFFDKNKTGEIINRLSSDVAVIGNSVTANVADGIRAVAQAFGSVGMMVYVSPKLTLLALMIVPPVAIMSRIYGRYLRKITKDVQDSLAGATSVAEERISNIRTVRAFAREQHEMGAYNRSIKHVLNLSYKESNARSIFWAMTGFSGNVIILSVFYAGGMMMDESVLSIGELSAFLLYAGYVGLSIGGMTSFYTELMRGLGASTRIWELSDRSPLIPITGGAVPATPLEGQIDFRDVSFNYPTRPDATVLSRMNLTVPSGSVTAVVGSSGSGKSTVVGLMLRFYDPNSGSVYLDGEDIRNIDPTWLRNHIGVVSQEPALFSCSVADNIRYGAADPDAVTMEMIEEAARQANADIFIKAFPQRFDTLVGERGLMLSGGQRQRIALARAILKDPKILLLDEATSALDSESEYYVKEALDRLMVGRTVITIAHRLSTIRTADQIAVLDNGAVAELGSYHQLISIENGIFKRLVEKQTITM